jgi:hypothetical protein
MWKKLIVLMLEFTSSLAGNLIAGWIQQDAWSNIFSQERIAGTFVGAFVMLFFIALLDTRLSPDHKLLSAFSYSSRSKRSLDEKRLLPKYELLAKERVRNSLTSMKLWNCTWTWEWSNNLDPENIQGHCSGGRSIRGLLNKRYACDYPVRGGLVKHSGKPIAGLNDIGIICTREKNQYHDPLRAVFRDVRISGMASYEEINAVVSNEVKKAIIEKRNQLIIYEIKKMRFQPWR